jgi:hypothetical protein
MGDYFGGRLGAKEEKIYIYVATLDLEEKLGVCDHIGTSGLAHRFP